MLTSEESLSLLSERAGLEDDPEAAEVAEEAGHLPLALAQAAATVRRQRLTFAEFLRRLRTIPVHDYLGRRPGDPYPHGAAAAILLSLESAEREDPRARPLIDLLAVLSPAGVDRRLVRAAGTEAEIDDVLGLLADASLVAFGIDGTTVMTHRFVQRVVRDRARSEGTLAVAARLIIGGMPRWEEGFDPEGGIPNLRPQVSSLWAAVEHDVSRDWTAAADLLGLRTWEVGLALKS